MLNSKSQALKELNKLTNSENYKSLSPKSQQDMLSDIVNRTSVELKGSVTILYSGTIDLRDDKRGKIVKKGARKIALDVYETDIKKFRIIDKTPAGELLNSDEFNTALYATIGVNWEDYKNELSDPEKKEKIKELELSRLYNTDQSKGELGMWSITSKRFIEYTKGEVIALIGQNASETRVFGKIEIVEIVKNKDITSINSKRLEELREESIKENISIETKIFKHSRNSTDEELDKLGYKTNSIFNAMKEIAKKRDNKTKDIKKGFSR